MIKLTTRRALEIGLELWEWLWDNPRGYKHDWPGWDKYGVMNSECPLCEYVGIRDCSKCPIYWRAKPSLENHCCRSDTPYEKWCDASNPRSRKFWAGKVVKLHREALERLEE